MALSAVFTAVQASVDRAHLAPAVSSLYLSQGFGCVVGLAAVSAVFQAGLRGTLEARLARLGLGGDLRDEVCGLCRNLDDNLPFSSLPFPPPPLFQPTQAGFIFEDDDGLTTSADYSKGGRKCRLSVRVEGGCREGY